MRAIKIKGVVCVNNEVEKHSAANLLPGDIDEKRNWLCKEGTSRGIVTLELECCTVITAIRIGNANSAFVEILVGNLADSTDKYETLVPPTQFMTFEDSHSGNNTGRVKFFYQKDFRKSVAGKEWEVIQLVCTQPFNKRVRFGICFVQVTGLGEDLVTVPERKKEEQTPSVPNIEKSEPKAAEVTQIFESSSKIKAASINIRSPGSEDYTDSRRNKFVRFELGSPQESMADRRGRIRTLAGMARERVRNRTRSRSENRNENRSALRRPFSKLMEDVFFTISGFKNPERAEIRNRAMEMGATYSPDWNARSTHLICSLIDTPKYKQVKGHGKIVKKEWITACHRDRKRYPWRRFALEPNEAVMQESEDEILAEANASSDEDVNVAGPSNRRAPEQRRIEIDPEETETDDDTSAPNTANFPMPYLPNLLTGKVFYVDPNLPVAGLVKKYIVAYNGILATEIDRKVDFYISETGGIPVRIMRLKAPHLKAVRPSWIWAMNSASKWISPWKFLLPF